MTKYFKFSKLVKEKENMKSTTKKRVTLFAALVLLILSLVSCSLPKDTLSVKSDDYPRLSNLPAADFPYEEIKNNNSQHIYNRAYCVDIKEDALWIYDGRKGEDSKSSVLMMNNGYFVGVNLGHMDGWVRYFPYYSSLPEAGELKIVTNDYFYGFAKINDNSAYLLTTVPTLTDDAYVNVYKLLCKDDIWNWTKIASLNGYPNAYCYDQESNSLYVSTYEGVFVVDEYQNESFVKVPDCWSYMGVNSMVINDKNIYFGTDLGIYVYSLSDKSAKWYPINTK